MDAATSCFWPIVGDNDWSGRHVREIFLEMFLTSFGEGASKSTQAIRADYRAYFCEYECNASK